MDIQDILLAPPSQNTIFYIQDILDMDIQDIWQVPRQRINITIGSDIMKRDTYIVKI